MSTAIDQTTPGVIDHVDTEILPFEENHDSNRKAHWVRPTDNGVTSKDDPTTSQDIVDMARLTDAEVVAACGTRFVPKHNPKGLPVCERCTDIANNAILGRG